MTEWAAEQYDEADRKGTLEVGKLADLVILDKDPLKVDPMTIKDIQIVETIKEGVTIHPAAASTIKPPSPLGKDPKATYTWSTHICDMAGSRSSAGSTG